MGRAAVVLVNYFLRNKVAFTALLIACLLFSLAGMRKLKISEDIFSALPQGREFGELSSLLENRNIANQCIFSIAVNNDDPAENTELVYQFADTIAGRSSGLLTNITSVRPDVEAEVYNYFFKSFPAHIDTFYYQRIGQKINPDSIRAAIINVRQQLSSPAGSFTKNFLINDPLFLSVDFFKKLNSQSNPQGVIVEDGLVYTSDKKQLLITAKTNFNAHETEKNIELNSVLENLRYEWNNQHPKNRCDYFGTFQIAAENAIQVKKDTFFTLSLSLVIILLILIVYYRKPLIPFYFVMPALFGGMMAMGFMGFFHPEVSAISLATSAIILGIILDYSFHFFTHLRHTGSVTETVHEITVPLLTGSITTVLALAALTFTDSIVLHDFGMFASVALAGAAFFTIICLPVILKLLKFSYRQIPERHLGISATLLSPKTKTWSVIIITLLTFFFLYHSQNIRFDADLDSLSFHPTSLKQKEQQLAGIDPLKEKKIYVFANDADKEIAAKANFELYKELEQQQENKNIKSFLSSAPFVVPESVQQERLVFWNNYWKNSKSELFVTMDKVSDSLGFSADAFIDFKKWIEADSSIYDAGDSLLLKTGIDNLVNLEPGKNSFITTIVVKTEKLEQVKSGLRKIKGVQLFDRAETAGLLLKSVQSDFNYILWVSASIVFITLLIIFGRIELALLAFLPMVVSWIWILGIASLLDIPFNFVNVVVATFIFGLGDDFSIFVTDGLLHKYKYHKNILRSYQSAILLSALTVIIGTGTLFFAKHPAIHSVAAISVIGIAVILVISFLFQPFLFGLFVQNRIEKKRTPIPLFQFIISTYCFAYFVLGCIVFHVALLISYITPLPKKFKQKLINAFISAFSRSVIYSGIHVKKRIFNKENLQLRKPAIIVANHSSFLDILLMLMLYPKTIIMVKDWVYKSPLFGWAVRYAGYIYSDSGNEKNLQKIKSRMDDGYSIVIFPEGSRSEDATIHRFHKGAFFLAEKLNVDIVPILIHGANEVSPKNEIMVKNGELNLKVLPRITADDTSWGKTYTERAKNILAYFRKEHAQFKNEREDARYLWTRIFYNYIFKGPVMEWYGKVKYRLEASNYDFYEKMIGQRKKILDLGCGYGFMSFFLHYKDPQRKITAVDYDDEKIKIAYNSYDKTENLEFANADIGSRTFEKQDVIFLNDVLHYLTPENQETVLRKCAEALQPGGIIFIRDGITDHAKNHSRTKLTEFLSTRFFSFNKKQNELHFFHSDFIRQFAEQNNLHMELKKHSSTTSNVLFILSRNENQPRQTI